MVPGGRRPTAKHKLQAQKLSTARDKKRNAFPGTVFVEPAIQLIGGYPPLIDRQDFIVRTEAGGGCGVGCSRVAHDWRDNQTARIIARADAEPTLHDLTVHLQARCLARHKHPERLIVVKELPRTASGKIRKDILRAVAADEAGMRAGIGYEAR